MQIGVSTWYPDQPSDGFDQASAALFARMTTPPTAARAALIDTMVKALKAAGIWDKMDALYVMAAADSQSAGLNWKSSSYTLSPVNSPTFTTDRGYRSDGVTAYLETNCAVGTIGGQFSQNSAHAAVWINTDQAVDLRDMGTPFMGVNSRNSTNGLGVALNAAETIVAAAASDARGYSGGLRNNSASIDIYKNGALLGNRLVASAAMTTETVHICKRNGNPSPTTRRVAVGHFGSALTPQNFADAYTIFNTYLTAVGGA
ncbi:hypothetical protein [Mesorhizobium sp. ES1-1]|uniref:hypothetical protein n=1 Tax=Mesorhizobium sp. ES1-1 TaxID=2876629 RepID=UPI001CCF36E1|nr:hypothetical protein [Mesorhizobium sp. ES1-1]MBZ9674559.1 hypothetical protein [Mesorhizobium sp. ES1-1]